MIKIKKKYYLILQKNVLNFNYIFIDVNLYNK